MIKKILFIIIVGFCGLIEIVKAQDPQFSQFYAVPLYLSPSFAGSSAKKTRVSANYRNQWPEIPKAYVTYSFAFDHYVSKIKSGVGFLMVRDVAGPGNLSTTNIGGIYSYDIQVNQDFHIRPGAHFMYSYRTVDFNKLVFIDQMVGSEDEYAESSAIINAPNSNRKGDADFTLSTLAYNKYVWLGVTVDHLLQPNYSFYGNESVNPIKYSVFGGTKVLLKERLLVKNQEDVSFAFLYKRQLEYQQFDAGAYYFKNPMIFGIWYRGIPLFKDNYPGSDALVFLLGYRIENVSMGYSYDFTISKLRNKTGGTHELSIIYSFKLQKWVKRPSSLPCPEF